MKKLKDIFKPKKKNSQQADAGEQQSKTDFFEKFTKKAELMEEKELQLRKTQQENIDKLNSSFDGMVDKLENINGHLEKHVSQQSELLRRFEVIPELTEKQTDLMEKTHKHLEEQAEVTEQFSEVAKEIPEQARLQQEKIAEVKSSVDKSCGFEESMCAEFAKLNVQIAKQGKYISMLWIAILVISVIAAAGFITYIVNVT
ncbi:hypothetical protein L21SP3_00122 [Sedimentisphaera cyanobacteriorum]|uniref:Uncharacterized protein n=1 Tax=Sedimentisphaera cyanobacteriorum TaxID=1940790 RepID=A0A1Q2HMA3_9BACT|nr:hypothetical protein [Sedimentisphaera cyanobacteriorum]AQQ08346.1 hypothetical protein L21SP3_00122 [Sedimentisphaera cyanobacteriorum]